MEASAATNPTTPAAAAGDTILQVDDLIMHFPITQGIIFQRQVGAVRAVDGVSFAMKRGEPLVMAGLDALAFEELTPAFSAQMAFETGQRTGWVYRY